MDGLDVGFARLWRYLVSLAFSLKTVLAWGWSYNGSQTVLCLYQFCENEPWDSLLDQNGSLGHNRSSSINFIKFAIYIRQHLEICTKKLNNTTEWWEMGNSFGKLGPISLNRRLQERMKKKLPFKLLLREVSFVQLSRRKWNYRCVERKWNIVSQNLTIHLGFVGTILPILYTDFWLFNENL